MNVLPCIKAYIKNISRSRPLGEQFLVRWAIPQLHDIDALARMVDITLNGAYPVKSLSRFADIISRCIQVNFFIPLFMFLLLGHALCDSEIL